jgi:hypothetical protein
MQGLENEIHGIFMETAGDGRGHWDHWRLGRLTRAERLCAKRLQLLRGRGLYVGRPCLDDPRRHYAHLAVQTAKSERQPGSKFKLALPVRRAVYPFAAAERAE